MCRPKRRCFTASQVRQQRSCLRAGHHAGRASGSRAADTSCRERKPAGREQTLARRQKTSAKQRGTERKTGAEGRREGAGAAWWRQPRGSYWGHETPTWGELRLLCEEKIVEKQQQQQQGEKANKGQQAALAHGGDRTDHSAGPGPQGTRLVWTVKEPRTRGARRPMLKKEPETQICVCLLRFSKRSSGRREDRQGWKANPFEYTMIYTFTFKTIEIREQTLKIKYVLLFSWCWLYGCVQLVKIHWTIYI